MDTIDLLQIKIENAKKQLSQETLDAIAAVPWQAEIIKMRETKGFTFEQLGDLEIETELVLCGLLNPKNYSAELENRMKISKGAANELVEEMNKLVFSKIKEELIKITEKKKLFGEKEAPGKTRDTEQEKITNAQVFKDHGIEIINENIKETLPIPEKLELKGEVIHPILAQKMSGPVQAPIIKTEHTLNNLTPTSQPSTSPKTDKPKIDPYREIPE
jgi:hypothetical protein